MNFLKKLFAKKAVKQAAEVPPEFLRQQPQDWLVDLQGQGLPYGGAFSIRVGLYQFSRTGSAEVFLSAAQEGARSRSMTASLEKPEVDRLLVVLGFAFPDDISNIPSEAQDGCPVKISIYHREPWFVKASACNLDGWLDTRKSKPPTVEIGLLLLDIQKRVLPA